MTEPALGRYHFLPWVRRGAALAASTADPLRGPLPAHLDLNVQLTLQALRRGTITGSGQATQAARVYGPGDVIGIDPRHVIRTEPRALTPSFEPNYLAGIEFDQPDFPWLFTPAAPSGDRLRPWLCLVVLRQDEFTQSSGAPDPLPWITVTKPVLPDLSDAWAWAHGQVTGDLPGDGLGGLLATTPQRALSRLLCPRKLDPDTAYSAFLVPAFEAGRLAGLGLDPGGADTDAAWQPDAAGVELPFYYRFDFGTADRGDFESLVRLLTPRVLPGEIGIRPMDVSQPGPGVPSAGPPLGLSGALRSLLTQDTPWPNPGHDDFQTTVVPLLNLTSPTVQDPADPNLPPDPAVVPPIYGRWHAAVASVTANGQRWIDQLNTDPRDRSPAGMGRQVVDQARAPLLASAWQQVAGIERANQLLRQAQLARAAMLAAFAAHFQPALPPALLTLTAPLHARLQASPRTVRAALQDSRLPVRALSGTFRQVARPLGPIRRRQGATAVPAGQMVERLNRGDITPVPPTHPPRGMTSIDSTSSQLFPAWAPGWLRRLLPYAFWILVGLGLVLLGVLLAVGLVVLAVMLAAVAFALAVAVRRYIPRWRAGTAIRFAALTPAALTRVPARPGFQPVLPGTPTPPGPGGGGDSAAAAAFRTAVEPLSRELQAPAPDPRPPLPASLPALQATILARLDPEITVPARMAALVDVAARLGWAFPEDPIEPIMAAPEFPQPMYEPLRDLDQSLLLPGVELIPPDTLGLLLTHHEFIEAYMVGLNHEMARQLLWEAYLTDQRGSYFRQFWDVRSYVPLPTDPADPGQLREKLKDIPPIHTWPLSNRLGGNQNRPEITDDKLVLLIRGELLRRYPNTILYAAQAQWDGDGQPRVIDDTQHRYPLFRGTLSPDITFVGFDLTAAQARGGQRDKGEPAGWFFVFQEQPTEPRFGLEPGLPIGDTVTEWNDLSWANFNFPPATSQSPIYALARVQPTGVTIQAHADSPQDPDNRWGTDSGQTAFITYRRPDRVAVHADMMLPTGGT